MLAESVSKQTVQVGTGSPKVEVARLKYHLYAQVVDSLFGWLRTLARVAGWAFAVYCLYRTVGTLAGQNTTLSAVANSVVNIGFNKGVAYAVAAICGVGFVHQRRLRLKTVRDQSGYIQRLESKLDPGRTSSGLMETGRPRKEDRDAI